MSRAPHLRDSPVTTRIMLALRHGLNVHCGCGHHGRISPDVTARAPDTQIYDYKCMLRCSRCGRSGDGDDIEVRIFVENAPLTTPVLAHARGPSLQSTVN